MKKIFGLFISLFIIIVSLFTIVLSPKLYDYINSFFDKTSDLYENFNLDVGVSSNGDLIDDSELSKLEDSGITGEGYNFDTNIYPYYTLLNNDLKKLYKQIYANANELATTFVPINNINIDDASRVINAIYNDHPELFWLDTSYAYKYTEDKECVQIILKFNGLERDINYNKKLFETNANKIINEAQKYDSDYEKELFVHDTLVNFIDYDINSSYDQSAFSGLVIGKTVCAGYARAFQYIMLKLNIPTFYVTGYAEEDHAWNIVKLSDGYYNVDLTWDDSTKNHDYFNLTDNEFNTSHQRTDDAVYLPNCNGNLYKYDNFS